MVAPMEGLGEPRKCYSSYRASRCAATRRFYTEIATTFAIEKVFPQEEEHNKSLKIKKLCIYAHFAILFYYISDPLGGTATLSFALPTG
jgi:hypothetical protein